MGFGVWGSASQVRALTRPAVCVGNEKKTPPKESHNIKKITSFFQFLFRYTKRPNNHTGQTGQNAKFVLNNGGPNGPDGSKRQVRAEQWGGPNGSDGSKRQIRAEQWGGRTGQTGQNAKFVLNNGGAERVRQVKTPNAC